MSLFEAIMLICFGMCWPLSIAKALRTKIVSGKSPVFMAVAWVGYMSGIIHKILYSPDWIISLYILNMIMVSIDFALYYKYLPQERNTIAMIGERDEQ